ncbi:NAD-dependent epimerase/dehydratase family protein [Actinoplanes awajinensis]|uniref:Epimerase n=1 Tax=Actinoplanes awajinensis subsp. mycoplanecinus TaxID=135947 RepID=A0A0X3UNW8_9ACTN|nr:NAD-dependent epimerase/dehydratase family protein [Actinoplanes awajinensis]KUL34234.1 epimerase [Actinoplanes awajinensis subsp. mycoplanecinus]
MNVFLTGATGYIGSALLPALISAGHTVTALVRDGAKAERVRGLGAVPVIGSIDDHDLVRRLAAGTDAVIATASPGDQSSSTVETAFADAVLDGLRPGGTFVRTGGVWVHGSGAEITERTPRNAPDLVAWREALDTRVLSAPGIRSLLVEPGLVYGHGKGIITYVVGAEKTGGEQAGAEQAGEPAALRLVGPGTQHWTSVHVDDLAELYLATLTHGATGEVFLGVSGDNPTVRELGEAASHRLGLQGRVVPETPDALVDRLGGFGAALLLDQQATGEKARTVLGWKPSRPSLLEDIAGGGYDPR